MMTDDEMTTMSRSLALAVLQAVEKRGLSGDAATAVVSEAFMEALGQKLGVFGAVERMRLLADIAEQQVLN